MKNVILIFLVAAFSGCFVVSYNLDTSRVSNVVMVTKNYPYNNRIVTQINLYKQDGLLDNFSKKDSISSSTFFLQFRANDTINLNRGILPYGGEYSSNSVIKKMEILLYDSSAELTDTLFYLKGGEYLVNRFRKIASRKFYQKKLIYP